MAVKRQRRSLEPARPAAGRAGIHPHATHGAIVAIVILVGVAYANALSSPLIYDDTAVVRNNPTIRNLWPLSAPLSPPPAGTPVSGRPVVNLTLAINYAAGGLDPRGYHVVNIAIHAGCALLLFGIVRRTFDSIGGERASVVVGFLAAALWAVHPLNTEAVTHISARTESLMAFCFLSTIYAGIRAAASTTRTWAAVSISACAAGMACKESMVIAPLILALYDAIFRAEPWRKMFRTRRGLYLGLASTWLLFVWLNWAWPRGQSAGFVADAGLYDAASTSDYLMNQARLIPRYVRLALWPSHLVLDYGMVRPLRLSEVAVDGIAILVAIGVTIALLFKRPSLGFLGAWFFATLAPASSIVPIFSEVGAERRMYLPLMAMTTGAAVAAYTLCRRANRWSMIAAAATAACVLAALTTATIARNREYASAVGMWRTVVARWPHGRARYNLAMALRTEGRLDEARTELRAAVDDYPEALSVLGIELLDEGHLDEGIQQLQHFIHRRPTHANVVLAHGRIADARFGQQRYAEAIPEYRTFLAVRPQVASAWTNLGISLAASGEPSEAISAFRRGLALAPGSSDAHRNLANALLENREYDEAVREAREAVRLGPQDRVAREILSLAVSGQQAGVRR